MKNKNCKIEWGNGEMNVRFATLQVRNKEEYANLNVPRFSSADSWE
jgi:hypothetical protein